MIPSNPLLAAEHKQESVTIGDGGLAQFHHTYFTGKNAAAYNHGPNRHDSRGHFQLVDSDKVFESYGKVVRNVNYDHLLWINRILLPTEYTTKIEFDVQILNFNKNVTVEPTPNESVSRYIDISKEKINFRSKRYGLAMYFELDRMMTEDGKEDFAMFAKKIAQIFRMHAAYLAMVRLLQPDSTESKWYQQYGQPPQNITDEQMRTEVKQWGCGNKDETGALELIWTYAKAFEYENGVKPDFVIFHPEKQAIFKFQNGLLNEYYRGGKDAAGQVMDYDEIANIQGMSFRGLPAFPSNVYDADPREASLLSRIGEIGNHFVFRRNEFERYENFRDGVHNYLDIFSETSDGMHRLREHELLANCGRWDPETGFLHKDHEELAKAVANMQRSTENVDMFLYFDRDLGKHSVCNFIGDMEPEYLKRSLFKQMVNQALRKVDVSDVSDALDVVETFLTGNDRTVNMDRAFRTITQFVTHLSSRLGGNLNPVFDSDRLPSPAETAGRTLTEMERAALVFLDNCLFFDSNNAGQVIGAVDPVGTNMDLYLQKMKDQIRSINSSTMPDEDYQLFFDAGRNLTHFYSDTFVRYQQADSAWYNSLKSLFDTVVRALAHPNTVVGPARGDRHVLDETPIIDAVRAFNALVKDNNLTRLTEPGVLEEIDQARVAAEADTLRITFNTFTEVGMPTFETSDPPDQMARKRARMTNGFVMGEMLTSLTQSARTDQGPLHFIGYKRPASQSKTYRNADGSAAYYTERGLFGETNVFNMRGSTMTANVTYVMNAYTNPIERAAALALLAVPCHLGTFENMLANDIQIPMDYLVLRPWMRYLMSDIILAKGGKGLGKTVIGYGHTAVGWKVPNKTGDLHTTQWMGAIIYNYALRCIIRHAFYEKAYGGAGHRFFSDAEYDDHVANDFITNGYDRPSLLCVSIPVDSYVKEENISITGFHPGRANEGTAHYHSWMYASLHYRFSKIRGQHCSMIHDASEIRTNVVTYQGTQRQCGNVNGDPGDLIENKGHHGRERPGDRDVRQGGMKIKSKQQALMT